LVVPIHRAYQFKAILKQSETELRHNSSVEDTFFLVLEDPDLAKSFESFAVEAWCAESLVFYRAARRFRTLADNQLVAESKKMWDLFFIRDAKFEINIDSSVKEEIMEKMLEERIDCELFGAAELSVLVLLKQTIFPLWKQSEKFKNDMKKLKISSLEALKTDEGSKRKSRIFAASKTKTMSHSGSDLLGGEEKTV